MQGPIDDSWSRSLGGFYTGLPVTGTRRAIPTSEQPSVVGAASPNLFLSHCHTLIPWGPMSALLGIAASQGVSAPFANPLLPEEAGWKTWPVRTTYLSSMCIVFGLLQIEASSR